MSTANLASSSAFQLLWTPIESGDEHGKGLRGYVGSLDEATAVLKSFEVASSLKYIKDFDWIHLASKSRRGASKNAVRFRDFRDSTIPEDGVPFMTIRHISYACEYGQDKNAQRKKRVDEDRDKMLKGEIPLYRRRKKNKETKKLGCMANIHVKQITRFTDYKDCKSAWSKRKASEAIRVAILNGEILKTETRFYIRLPCQKEHLKTHSIGENTSPTNGSLPESALHDHVPAVVHPPLKNPSTKRDSSMTCHALRLRPNDELRTKLLDYVRDHGLKAAFILTCVGSLSTVSLRMSDSETLMHLEKNHEIVSLVGTLSGGHGHLHISLSDEKGNVFGGHLIGNAKVFTTAEVVIGELPQLAFSREPDPETGYDELTIDER